jgi:hypothetical protein
MKSRLIILVSRRNREYRAKNTRGSSSSSTSLSLNYATSTWRSTRRHAPSRYKRPQVNRRKIFNRNFCDRIKCHIAPSRGGKAEGHNLRTKHRNLVDPNHRGRKITVHGRRTHETSSHKHGLTDLATNGTKGIMKTNKQRWGHHASPTGFTKMQVPKGFKLPHDQQKYDGSQEPESWLTYYLQAVKILGGSKATSMQSLQLHLTGAARSWLSKLPKESIGDWNDLEKQFTGNFRSTYTRPALIKELKACTKKTTSHYACIYNAGA